jgi:hypothetical protein
MPPFVMSFKANLLSLRTVISCSPPEALAVQRADTCLSNEQVLVLKLWESDNEKFQVP